MEHPAEPPTRPATWAVPFRPNRSAGACTATRRTSEPCSSPKAAPRLSIMASAASAAMDLRGITRQRSPARFPNWPSRHPTLASAPRIVALCGECHTAPAKTTPHDPGFVRYQASGLVLSRCFTESEQSLSCTTCHDPHKDVETRAVFYETKCLKCHAGSARTGDRPNARGEIAGASCRVDSRGGCLDCHMPRVNNAVPRTVFTDHHIRVRRD